ncbi:MAG TPA: DUF1318 domain-containing protein [Terricaulis sp.]|nr:DUF1318 domain-containing protein [Terricaulis sp.]
MKNALLTVVALAGALALASPAAAQDAVLNQARAAGLIGEQADGYLGIAPGADVSADVRARVDQNNMRRRALYTQRATDRGASVNEMAAAVACEVFQGRIAVGERYRDEGGQWRQRTASAPVAVPSFCGN